MNEFFFGCCLRRPTVFKELGTDAEIMNKVADVYGFAIDDTTKRTISGKGNKVISVDMNASADKLKKDIKKLLLKK